MSLELIERPGKVSLSGNQVVYKFRSNNLYNGVFIYPKIDLVFSGMVPFDEFFTIEFTDGSTDELVSLTFRAVEFPDEDQTEFYDDTPRVGIITTADYVAAVFPQIARAHQVNSFYDVTYDGNVTITLTAREAAADYVLNFFTDTTVITGTTSDDYHVPEQRTGYKGVLEVWFEDVYDSDHFRYATRIESYPDENGDLFFDIGEILKGEMVRVMTTAPLPDYSLDVTNVVTPAGIIREFYVKFSEVYGGVTQVQNWEFDIRRTLLHGAVSQEDFAKNDLVDYIRAKQTFLTWSPGGKRLQDDQKEYLVWMNYNRENVIPLIELDIYYSDGTSSLNELMNGSPESFNLKPYHVCYLPVSYDLLDIGSIEPAKTVIYWDVRVYDLVTTSAVSSDRRYFRDTTEYLYTRDLIWLNGLCSPENLRTVGKWVTEQETVREFIDPALLPDYKVVDGKRYQFDQESDNVFTVRTGYMMEEFALALRDHLQGKNLFILESEGLVPAIILSDAIPVTEDGLILHAYEYTLRKSIPDKDYSDQNRVPVLTEVHDCGLTALEVDANSVSIQTYNNLTVHDGEGNLLHTVVWSGSDYPLPSKLIAPDTYFIEASWVDTDGNTLEYLTEYVPPNARITYTVNDNFTTIWLRATEASVPVFFNFKDGNGWQSLTVGTTATSFGAVYATTNTRNIEVQTPCQSKIDQIAWNAQGLLRYDVEAFSDLQTLSVFQCTSIDQPVDLAFHPNLTLAQFTGCIIEKVDAGLPVSIGLLLMANNQFTDTELERLIFYLWNHRTLFDNIAKIMNISGNPGSASLSTEALDAINGTNNSGLGIYLNDGLVDNNWIVTY